MIHPLECKGRSATPSLSVSQGGGLLSLNIAVKEVLDTLQEDMQLPTSRPGEECVKPFTR